jgi:hypothetical protein
MTNDSRELYTDEEIARMPTAMYKKGSRGSTRLATRG